MMRWRTWLMTGSPTLVSVQFYLVLQVQSPFYCRYAWNLLSAFPYQFSASLFFVFFSVISWCSFKACIAVLMRIKVSSSHHIFVFGSTHAAGQFLYNESILSGLCMIRVLLTYLLIKSRSPSIILYIIIFVSDLFLSVLFLISGGKILGEADEAHMRMGAKK